MTMDETTVAIVDFFIIPTYNGKNPNIIAETAVTACTHMSPKLSSEVGFKGIFKKVIIFSLVAVGHIVDTHIIGEGSVLRTAVIFFYLSNEGISILENAARTGLPIPGKLKAVLEQLREEKEN